MWIIYGRYTADEKFRPINLESGDFVARIIDASIFWEQSAEDMDDIVARLSELNPFVEFEYRRVK